MKKDGRTLSHEVSEYLRIDAVRRVDAGESPRVVIDSLGLCRTTIYRWIRAAKKKGLEALKAKKHTGPVCKLSSQQKQTIRKWICGKDPRQYGFDFGLWTRKIVQHMIQEKFGIQVSITTTGSVLAEMGITPQKPLRRAYEQDPVAVEKWKSEIYPCLKKRAKSIGADIFFLDEAGIRSDAPLQRTWGEKGKTPILKTSGQRQSVNAISAVNILGAFWFTVYSGSFNATVFKGFLKDFLRGRRRPVFLVVDGHPSHKAKMISKYVEETRGKLELHFLPTYSPELNPDELVWNNLRQRGTSKKPLKKNESLKERVRDDLARIKKDSELVRSFFHAESVAYTAD